MNSKMTKIFGRVLPFACLEPDNLRAGTSAPPHKRGCVLGWSRPRTDFAKWIDLQSWIRMKGGIRVALPNSVLLWSDTFQEYIVAYNVVFPLAF